MSDQKKPAARKRLRGGKSGATEASPLKRKSPATAPSKKLMASEGRGKPANQQASANAGKRLRGKAKVLDSRVSFKGNVFTVATDRVEEPGGVTATRDVIRHSGSVIVLAVDTSRSARNPTVLIERQYRHAAGQFLLELPAGRMEPGERPLAAAKRELIEETGFRARKWTPLTRYFASPGFLTEEMLVYLAEDIYPGVAQPEEDERIELLHIPLLSLLEDIAAGKIKDGKTILSVLLFTQKRRMMK